MSDDLFDMMEELDSVVENEETRDNTVLRAPFGYPGGKSRSVYFILKHLPYTDRWIDVFGGSAAITLARKPCKLEVFNDRYAGVVAFYRVIRDKDKYEQLVDRLDLIIHSREEFAWCKETWETCYDDIERAARWYYMVSYSFGCLGRNFGRSKAPTSRMAGKIRQRLEHFQSIHERFHRIQVENQDWEDCIHDYDHPDTVFYLDPPYVDGDQGIYKHKMKQDSYNHFVDEIFKLKGFVALSSYSNPVFDNRDWDAIYRCDVFVSMKSLAFEAKNHKEHLKDVDDGRGVIEECLYVKEARF